MPNHASIPSLTPLLATAGSVAASIPAIGGLFGSPIAVAGATLSPASIFLAPLALPFLFASFFQGSPEDQAILKFRMHNSLPRGTPLDQFGLPGRFSPAPNIDVFVGLGGGAGPVGRSVTNAVRQAESAQRSGGPSINPRQLEEWLQLAVPFAARNALSFVPEVAAEGERRIAQFLALPVETPPIRRLLNPKIVAVAQRNLRDTAIRERVQRVETARKDQLALSIADPFYQAIVNAFLRNSVSGLAFPEPLRGTILPGVGRTIESFIPDFRRAAVQSEPRSSLTAQPPAPTPRLRAPVPSVRTTAREIKIESARAQGVQSMANVSTIPAGGGGGGFFGGLGAALGGLGQGVGGIIQAAAPLVPSILQATTGQSLPGGAPIPGRFADPRVLQVQQAGLGSLVPALGGALAENALDLLPPGLLPGFLGGGGGGGSATISPRTTTRTRYPSRVDVPTTDAAGNTRFVTFKNMGRPILFSGDIAACKRVRKVGTRVRRYSGGR